jgi:hypothetical protein
MMGAHAERILKEFCEIARTLPVFRAHTAVRLW